MTINKTDQLLPTPVLRELDRSWCSGFYRGLFVGFVIGFVVAFSVISMHEKMFGDQNDRPEDQALHNELSGNRTAH